METTVVRLRGRGNVTLPARMRDRYALAEGDSMTLVDLDGIIVLVPRVGLVGTLAGEIERLSHDRGVDVEDLIEGVAAKRAAYYTELGGADERA